MIEMLLKEYQTKLDARFDILLAESGQRYDSVISAARYSLISGGKRIRPVLLLEFYRLCGGADDCAYGFACALEMIHAYSLIHDDLPCMDDDDFRHGRPSCHKRFGETMALLAGDALLTEAFSVAARTKGLPADRITRATAFLAASAGIAGMVGGQVLDLEQEENSAENIIETYRLKTGALMKAAAVCGCILAGADASAEEAAAVYGERLGVAFQVIDDILDAQGDEALTGRPAGSDERNGRRTLVSVLGIERCRELAGRLTGETVEALESFEGDKTNLTELCGYLLSRKY